MLHTPPLSFATSRRFSSGTKATPWGAPRPLIAWTRSAFAKVEDFDGIVAQRADEQPVSPSIKREMVDTSFRTPGERDRLLQLKRRVTGFSRGEVIASRCNNQDKS